jgi:hypothetical protein
MRTICILLVTIFLISGCMNFNHVDIPEVHNKEPKTKPAIGIKVGDFKQYCDGEIDTRDIISNEKMGLNCLAGILNPWENGKLIKEFQAVGKYKKLPDYTLMLNGSIDEDSSTTLNIVSALTLFIIPSYTTASFDLSFVLINNSTKEEFKKNLKTSFTVWKDLIFLPVFPFFWIRMDNRITDKSMFMYHQFNEEGAFSNIN